jgi:hypothetical protein
VMCLQLEKVVARFVSRRVEMIECGLLPELSRIGN